MLLTWFYVRFLKLGYMFVGTLVFLPQVLKIRSMQDLSRLSSLFSTKSLVLTLSGTVLYLYLAVVWNLALVVSVCEDKSGTEAFRRASQLVQEEKLKLIGLYFNICFGFASLIVFVTNSEPMLRTKQLEDDTLDIMVNIFFGAIMNEVSTWLSFGVMHVKCKKSQEEKMRYNVSL